MDDHFLFHFSPFPQISLMNTDSFYQTKPNQTKNPKTLYIKKKNQSCVVTAVALVTAVERARALAQELPHAMDEAKNKIKLN